MTEADKVAYQLSRVYAEGWNYARSAGQKKGIGSNPYVTEPERTRWNKGYVKATS
jgi:hypothetical protein